jgi:hypothetical protein
MPRKYMKNGVRDDGNYIEAGCCCDSHYINSYPLYARWIITPDINKPVYHAISGAMYLSIRYTIESTVGHDVGKYNRILNSLMLLGTCIPATPYTSVLEAVNAAQAPPVSAVNAQWRQLVSYLNECRISKYMCVRYDKVDIRAAQDMLIFPNVKYKERTVMPHDQCKYCNTNKCRYVANVGSAHVLDVYGDSFFGPISTLLEIAISNGCGMLTDYVNRNTEPVSPEGDAVQVADIRGRA